MSLNSLLVTEEDVSNTLRWLFSSNSSTRANTLRILCINPIVDSRVLQRLKELLDDTSICLIHTPYLYGEIRWLAAKALHVATGETIQLSKGTTL